MKEIDADREGNDQCDEKREESRRRDHVADGARLRHD